MVSGVDNHQSSEAARPASSLRRWAVASGLVGVAVGLLVLTGWATRLEVLKRGLPPSMRSGLPDLPTMKANAAVCFLLAGAGLALHRWRGWRLLAGGLVACVSGLTLAEYVTGTDLGLDQLLATDQRDLHTLHPGRMAEVTALSFTLCGASLLLLDARSAVGRRVQQGAAVVVALLGLVGILGFAYDVQQLYQLAPSGASVALPTTVSLMVLAIGLVLARPDGLGRLLTTPGPGSQVARRLLPMAVVLPLLLGWLHVTGERAGWYSPPVGAGVFVLETLVCLVAVALWVASAMDRADADRRAIELDLRASERRFRSVFDHAATGIAITDVGGRFVKCNAAYRALTGYEEAELCARELSRLIHPDDRPANTALVERLLEGDLPSFEVESRYVHRDTRTVWGRTFVSLLHDEAGRPSHLVALVTDVTAQKNAEVERQQAEDALRQSEDRLRRAQEIAHLGAGSWICCAIV